MSSKSNGQIVEPWLFWLDQAEVLLSHPAVSLAPQRLWQSILPGWIFAQNVTVNSQNSSAPDTEIAVLAEESYGRQLGRVIDALDVLIRVGNLPSGNDDKEALGELIKLHDKVAKIKKSVGNDRLSRILRDLDALKTTDPAAYAQLVQSLSGE